jgi:hypothetical protein
LTDLKQILEDAAELAREALPDLKFTGNSPQWHLIVDDAFVGVVPWLKVPDLCGSTALHAQSHGARLDHGEKAIDARCRRWPPL